MLFGHSPSTIDEPHVDEDEVLCALPPYSECYLPLAEARHALFPTHWEMLIINRDKRPS